jgi:putative phosphoesterase
MKILVVSDTHGRHESLRRVLLTEEPVDMLIHCGDTEGGEDWIRSHTQCMSVPIVRGNNDFFSNLPPELDLDICGLKAFITHGHGYGISMGVERLEEEARDRGADIALFGHTHRPFIEERDGLWLINPGSLSYPRQEGHRHTYIIMTVEEGKRPVFTLKAVD